MVLEFWYWWTLEKDIRNGCNAWGIQIFSMTQPLFTNHTMTLRGQQAVFLHKKLSLKTVRKYIQYIQRTHPGFIWHNAYSLMTFYRKNK